MSYDGEAALAFQIRAAKLPEPEREFRFHPKRRWRFDMAWPKRMLAAEYEGGIYANGRHTRGKGYEGDLEKYNAAMLLGWRVLRFSARHVTSGDALSMIERALA